MSILCTCPGRHGDLLWAMATVRAIAETYGESVDLVVSQKYSSLAPLIERQAYIQRVLINTWWEVQETAPMTPRIPPGNETPGYARTVHLGYESWPTPDLARDIYDRAGRDAANKDRHLAPLDLTRPWLTTPYVLPPQDVTVGFTDEHFELKYGLYSLLLNRFCFGGMIAQQQAETAQARAAGFNDWSTASEMVALLPTVAASRKSVVWVGNSPRWQQEANRSAVDWETAASWIAASKVFVGCCSALHVLAVGLGKQVVCVEPQKDRQQDVFWPVGKTGRVRLVLGGDGLPTVDARHTGDVVEAVLKERV